MLRVITVDAELCFTVGRHALLLREKIISDRLRSRTIIVGSVRLAGLRHAVEGAASANKTARNF